MQKGKELRSDCSYSGGTSMDCFVVVVMTAAVKTVNVCGIMCIESNRCCSCY